MAAVPKTTHHGGCPHDCPDTCAMLFEVEDGRLTGVRGNPAHPMTRGGLCVKLKDYEKRHYHPDRLLHPMRRTGAKGEARFERISWDEALDRVADLMKADRDANFIEKNAKGETVNRWLTTGFLAASAASNEAGYLTHKVVRATGMLGFDNQARV